MQLPSARAPPGRRFQTSGILTIGGEVNMTEAVKLRAEEERLRALLRRADALNTAYVVVELDEWSYPEAKAEMLEALEALEELRSKD
jgi:hypothetical protein